jgi:hypothetical protein
MELLEPIVEINEWTRLFPKRDGESAQPQVLDDDPQKIAGMLGRQNVSYDPIWKKTEAVYPKWQPVHCNSLRRAVLLASSALQHRTMAFEVVRRGRLVVLRYMPEGRVSMETTTHAATA